MAARLDVRRYKTISRLELTGRPVTIGRSGRNGIVLRDTRVSRKHCVIEVIDQHPFIRDLDSHAGTFVNGVRIAHTQLRHGDRISVGPFDLVFKDRDGKKKPVLEEVKRTLADDESHSEEVTAIHALSLTEASAATDPRLAEQLRAAQERIEQLVSRIDQLQIERQLAVQLKINAEEALAESGGQIESLQKSLARQSERIDELTKLNATANAKIDELQNASRAERESGQAAMQEKESRIAELKAQIESLLQRLRSTEATRQSIVDRAARFEQGLNALRTQVRSLDAAADRVASIQDQLTELEEAWSDAEQMIENADDQSDDQAEVAQQHRQGLILSLEELNRRRDDAIIALHEAVRRLRTDTNRDDMKLITSAAADSAQDQPSARRWWRLGT